MVEDRFSYRYKYKTKYESVKQYLRFHGIQWIHSFIFAIVFAAISRVTEISNVVLDMLIIWIAYESKAFESSKLNTLKLFYLSVLESEQLMWKIPAFCKESNVLHHGSEFFGVSLEVHKIILNHLSWTWIRNLYSFMCNLG